MTLNQTIGANVADLLAKAGKTKTWLGEKLGVGRHQPGRLLSGENNWTTENLELAARAFGVSVADLVREGPATAPGGLTPEEQAIISVFRVDGYHGLLTHAAGRIPRP